MHPNRTISCRVPRPLSASLLLAFILAVAGCDALVDRPALTLDFGAPYNVLFGEPVEGANGLLHTAPFIDGAGELHVAVQFAGGCANHVFRLDYTLAETSATLWLRHADNGDSCEAAIIHEVVAPLPLDVLEKEEIVLVGPGGQDEVVPRIFQSPDSGP